MLYVRSCQLERRRSFGSFRFPPKWPFRKGFYVGTALVFDHEVVAIGSGFLEESGAQVPVVYQLVHHGEDFDAFGGAVYAYG